MLVHNQVSPILIYKMHQALEANKGYGNWSECHPNKNKMIEQIEEYSRVLIQAIKGEDKTFIKKHSVNLANFAEKAYSVLGSIDGQKDFVIIDGLSDSKLAEEIYVFIKT